MISFINGELAYKDPGMTVVDVGGIGYEILITNSTYNQLPETGYIVKLFTRLIIKEDELQLYGFFSKEELSLFLMILNVNGIGPKGAAALLSSFPAEALRSAIADENSALLAKTPGIGKKTAQRIILEIKDKINKPAVCAAKNVENCTAEISEGVAALVNLGYSHDEAKSAVESVKEQKGENIALQDIIKQSLKVLSNL
ncbi:MAG: Holliday junction branch migration protein RuvA [Clostridiales bacterium]|nr:Holliday junction branch migration protein RuvA [Clostridiales bacterium]MCF8022111.1 Holliday junction branch migration protein RuvA [Clostridiales bacterium]